MTAAEARTHLRYSGWASRRLLDAALQLPPEQLNRDLNASHKSVLDTLNHILMADRVWLHRVRGTAPEPTADPIQIEWPRVQQQWEEFAETIADADLARIIDYKDLRGNSHRSTLNQIILHVVNHATLHRGQVMAMFRQLGVAPPATDLIFFFREQQ